VVQQKSRERGGFLRAGWLALHQRWHSFNRASGNHHWTLTGTKCDPGGSGKRVSISGFEVWRLSPEGSLPYARLERDFGFSARPTS
jgi:hypothetical protein